MKIIFLPEVEDYLFNLIAILYRENYFGFQDSALLYVEELIYKINTGIHLNMQKKHSFIFLNTEKTCSM